MAAIPGQLGAFSFDFRFEFRHGIFDFPALRERSAHSIILYILEGAALYHRLTGRHSYSCKLSFRAMPEFTLFKISVLPRTPGQPALFGDRPRPEVLRDIIESLPSFELRKGGIWHVGNVAKIDEAYPFRGV